MIVVSDVDLCAVDTDLAWLKDLQTQYYNKFGEFRTFSFGEKKSYNLASYFPELTEEEGISFWSKEDLYDNLVPKTGCVETLKSFHGNGDQVVFTSYCKKGHYESKYNWCKKHFPFMEGFLATKEKHLVDADIFIDDRNDMLNRRMEKSPSCIVIKMDTEYQQEEFLYKAVDLVAKGWEDIKPYSIFGGR